MLDFNQIQTLGLYKTGLVEKHDAGREADDKFGYQMPAIVQGSGSKLALRRLKRVYRDSGTSQISSVGTGFSSMDLVGGTLTAQQFGELPFYSAGLSVAQWGDYVALGVPGDGEGVNIPSTLEYIQWYVRHTGSVRVYKRNAATGDYALVQRIQSPLYAANPIPPGGGGGTNDPYADCYVQISPYPVTSWDCGTAGERFGMTVRFAPNGDLIVSSACNVAALNYPATGVPPGRLYALSFNGTDTWSVSDYLQNPTTNDSVFEWFESYRYDVFAPIPNTNQGYLYNVSTGNIALNTTVVGDATWRWDYTYCKKMMGGDGTSVKWVAGSDYSKNVVHVHTAALGWTNHTDVTGTNQFGYELMVLPDGELAVADGSGAIYPVDTATVQKGAALNSTGFPLSPLSRSWASTNDTFAVYSPTDYDQDGLDYLPNSGAVVFFAKVGGVWTYAGIDYSYVGVLVDDGKVVNGEWASSGIGEQVKLSKDASRLAFSSTGGKFYDSTNGCYRPITPAKGKSVYVAAKSGSYVLDLSNSITGSPTVYAGNDASAFGTRFVVDGDWVFVSSPNIQYRENGSDAGANSGAVYAYKFVLGVLTLKQVLYLSEAITHTTAPKLGSGRMALDTADGLFIAGAPGADAVRVWQLSGDTWVPIDYLSPTDGSGGFGAAVSYDSGVLAVGAPLQDFDANGLNAISDAGAVYLYKWDVQAGAFSFTQKITGLRRAQSAKFGSDLVIEGSSLIIGIPGNPYDTLGHYSVQNGGAFETWMYTSSGWSRTAEYIRTDSNGADIRAANDYYGREVSMSGGRALPIGTFTPVDVFDRSGVFWEKGAQTTGYSAGGVDLRNETAAIGTLNATTDKGAVALFSAPKASLNKNPGAMLLFTE